MSRYYLLEKKVITCSSNLKEKYEQEGYKCIAVSRGYNNTLSER